MKSEYAKVFEKEPNQFEYEKAIKKLEDEIIYLESQVIHVIRELNQLDDDTDKTEQQDSDELEREESADSLDLDSELIYEE